MPPRFSVVIPTYNHADFLKVALQSVLNQTLQDFEVIVVNNHSTDHTLAVITEFNDDRVRVINFENHGVIGAARNVGINAAQGDHVAFLDSDDSWHPNKLELVATAIDEHPDAGLFCHNQELVRDGHPAGVAKYGPPAGTREDLYDYLLLRGNCVSTSAAVVARQYLEQVGSFSEDSEVITVEDYDLWLRLAKVCRFEFIPDSLGVHNYHDGGASTNTELHLSALIIVLDRHFSEYQGSGWLSMILARRRQYSNAYYGAARQYQRRRAVIRPLGHYLRTLKTYPFHFRAYAGLALLVLDTLIGKGKRQRILRAIASW